MSAGANSLPWQHEDLQCFIRRGKDTETMTQGLARSLCLLIGRAMSPTRRLKICNISCQQGNFAETKNSMFRFIMSPTSHRRSVVLIIGKYPITIRKKYSDYDYRLSYQTIDSIYKFHHYPLLEYFISPLPLIRIILSPIYGGWFLPIHVFVSAGVSRRHDDMKICNVSCLWFEWAKVADMTTWRFAMFCVSGAKFADTMTRRLAMFRVFVSACESCRLEDLQCFVSAGRKSPTRGHKHLQCFVSSSQRGEIWRHKDLQCFVWVGQKLSTWWHKDLQCLVSSTRRGESPRHDVTKICNALCRHVSEAKVADTTTQRFAMFHVSGAKVADMTTRRLSTRRHEENIHST